MRLGYIVVFLIFIVVAGANLTFHWYMGQNTPSARHLSKMYLHKSPKTGKQYGPTLPDYVIPCIILGATAGSIGCHWTSREMFICVLLLSLGLLLLEPLRPLCGNTVQRLDLWPRAAADLVPCYIPIILSIVSLCGFSAYIAWAIPNRDKFPDPIQQVEAEQVSVQTLDRTVTHEESWLNYDNITDETEQRVQFIRSTLDKLQIQPTGKIVCKKSDELSSGEIMIVEKVKCNQMAGSLITLSHQGSETSLLSLNAEFEQEYMMCHLQEETLQIPKSCLLDYEVYRDTIAEVISEFLTINERPRQWRWIPLEQKA